MKTQISIIGCGWLGLSLAKELVKDNYTVNGTTTTKEKLDVLENHQIHPFLIILNETAISGSYSKFLTGSDTIIINIPPGLRKNPNKNHVAELRLLIQQIEAHAIKNVLYISSTSVFENEDNFPIITAATTPNATSDSSKQLIEIEHMLQANSNFNTTILRFGGLIGETRHPAKFLSGKADVSDPEAPINLIHKTDAIGIIKTILKNDLWNVVLNAAYPLHPSKKDYYINQCQLKNLALPSFNTEDKSKGKIIESKLTMQLLNYTFKIAP
ncbi:NAD(P)H-binding protein [Winogradskyella costae]|uniref:NAD(P)H-binding protein n=1 Tax=Winogradskyella costae TaxID=2697008 RepID=UPI0015C7E7FA|nr:NAD(P)H-binding protein [Winogradskyella costae]